MINIHKIYPFYLLSNLSFIGMFKLHNIGKKAARAWSDFYQFFTRRLIKQHCPEPLKTKKGPSDTVLLPNLGVCDSTCAFRISSTNHTVRRSNHSWEWLEGGDEGANRSEHPQHHATFSFSVFEPSKERRVDPLQSFIQDSIPLEPLNRGRYDLSTGSRTTRSVDHIAGVTASLPVRTYNFSYCYSLPPEQCFQQTGFPQTVWFLK